MSGELTARLQAKIIPKLEKILQGAGQDVTIRRPGYPDATVRAFLYQLDDGDKQGKVSDPQVKVMAWQGIFKADAPLTLPFTVVDQQGRMFTPDGPVQDAGEQGVALIVHLLPLADRTRVSSLTFTIPGPMVKDPVTGNPRPGPGTPVTVFARLVASDDPRIRDMAGADAAEVVLIGRWGTLEQPRTRPNSVKWGSTAPLVVDGQNGTLTVKVAYPDPDVLQETQLGGRFVATWKSNP